MDIMDKLKIESWLEKHNVTRYVINEDLSVDVKGTVYLSYKHLQSIPIKFRNVSGSFFCSNNNLISLEGCPENVGKDFICSFNKLAGLDGCPTNTMWHTQQRSQFILTTIKVIINTYRTIFQ